MLFLAEVERCCQQVVDQGLNLANAQVKKAPAGLRERLTAISEVLGDCFREFVEAADVFLEQEALLRVELLQVEGEDVAGE